jgi:hypothetical protein
VGGTPGAKPDAIQTRRVVHVRRAAIKENNVCNRTDIQAYFGDATAGGIVAIRRNEEKNNEMPDYFVFVAWACRLLLDWSLCQRQR